MPRRCFITAPGEVNLAPILETLRARDWEAFALSDVAVLGSSFIESLESAIRSADVVVALLDADKYAGTNTAFEVGLATGLGKPVVVVAPSFTEIPSDLQSLLCVQATPDNPDAIALALENFERYKSTTESPILTGKSGRALGDYSDSLLKEVRQGSLSPQSAESIIVRAIEASGAVAVASAGSDHGFDIGVWSDDLDAISGNPLLVEIKQRVDEQAVRQCLAALHLVPGARAALIISIQSSEHWQAFTLNWPVLGVSLEGLLGQMRTQSFAEVVRELRNRSVHGLSF